MSGKLRRCFSHSALLTATALLVAGAWIGSAPGAAGTSPRVLRLADSGESIALRVGSPAIIRLNHKCWGWSASDVSGRAAMLEEVAYERDPGYDEWKIRPLRPGRTRITLKGNALSSCNASDRVFRLTVVVRAA